MGTEGRGEMVSDRERGGRSRQGRQVIEREEVRRVSQAEPRPYSNGASTSGYEAASGKIDSLITQLTSEGATSQSVQGRVWESEGCSHGDVISI